MNATRRKTRAAAAGALALLLAVPAAAVNDAGARVRYEKERAACVSGQTHQSRDTCLKEAAAAFAEARRGALDDGAVDYRRNAAIRCKPLPPDDRKDCEARMRGEGTVRGSVEEGGIYRETVTIEVGKPTQPQRQ